MSNFIVNSKRQQIIAEAALLFRKKGYMATSMKDIAEKVNIESASLYNHIKSKDEILEELVFFLANKFKHGMFNIKQSLYSPFEKVKALIALHIRITTENPQAIFLLNQDWMHLKEPLLSNFLKIRNNYSQDFSGIIVEGMENGSIKRANPEIMLNTILSSVRWLYTWYDEHKEISTIELEIQILEVLENGFKSE